MRSGPYWPGLRAAEQRSRHGAPLPSFTRGIEEEYQLIDRASCDLASKPLPEMMDVCRTALSGSMALQFLRCHIEVATGVCRSLDEAQEQFGHPDSAAPAAALQWAVELLAPETPAGL